MARLTTETDLSEDPSPSLASVFRPALILAQATKGPRKPTLKWLVGSSVILGRGSPALAGADDTRISREHARLHFQDGSWWLTDLESRNGTWLQGQRIRQTVPLPNNSVIRLGDTLLIFANCSPSGFFDDGLVSISATMAELRTALPKIARDDVNVLISGETGTGKEIVAQLLHGESGRTGPLVTVNCGALTESLLASELFGHIKGAFTGASDARDGFFRQADGGTLFLDEIGEMPLSAQVRLLRVLETRRVQPVGSTREFPINVRVIAATNRDLPAVLKEGAFRADLFARLAQRQLQLPALRERRADIPFLIHRLLERRGTIERPLTLPLMHRLLLHPWPFNVRGLRNVLLLAEQTTPQGTPLALNAELERLLQTENALAPSADAPPTPSVPTSISAPSPAPLPLPAPPPGCPPRPILEAMLSEHQGRVSEIARRLGCKRQVLYAWFNHHQLEPGAFR